MPFFSLIFPSTNNSIFLTYTIFHIILKSRTMKLTQHSKGIPINTKASIRKQLQWRLLCFLFWWVIHWLPVLSIWSPTFDFWSHWQPVSHNFEPCPVIIRWRECVIKVFLWNRWTWKENITCMYNDYAVEWTSRAQVPVFGDLHDYALMCACIIILCAKHQMSLLVGYI